MVVIDMFYIHLLLSNNAYQANMLAKIKLSLRKLWLG